MLGRVLIKRTDRMSALNGDTVAKVDWSRLPGFAMNFERFVVWVVLCWGCGVGSCARGDATPGKSLPGMVGRDREAWRAV